MIKNITIGQFYPVDSVIHRLDPRAKLLGVIAFITALFIVRPFAGYGVSLAALVIVIAASKVPVGFIVRGLKAVLFVVAFTAALNIFLTPGGDVLFGFLFIRITYSGVIIAVKMTLRLAMLVAASSVLTLTTTPTQITDALESLLKPLKKIKAPIHEVAMMMTIALRFIPTLVEETDKIMKAQAARGADFDTGGLIKKAKALVPLLVPLFISAIRRADELAQAMEARCYRGDIGRTKFKTMKYAPADLGFLGGSLALIGMSLGVNTLLG